MYSKMSPKTTKVEAAAHPPEGEVPQEGCPGSRGRKRQGGGCGRGCRSGAVSLRKPGEKEVRDEERRQERDQDDDQEPKVEVPKEEEQMGEADGGDKAAGVQEAHAKRQKGREGTEQPTDLPGWGPISRSGAMNQDGDVGML